MPKMYSSEKQQFKKAVVPADVYTARVLGVKAKTLTKGPRIIVDFTFEYKGEPEIVSLMMPSSYTPPLPIDGKMTNPSWLFKLMQKAGLCQEYESECKKDSKLCDDDQVFAVWLEGKIVGRYCKVNVGDVTPTAGGSVYSAVKEVIKFLDDLEVKREIV